MLWPFVKIALLPAALLWFSVEIVKYPFARAAKRRILLIALCAVMVAGLVAWKFQPLASLARNYDEYRDVLNPVNVINATRGYIKYTERTLPTVMRPVGADVVRGDS